jgi:hypothetical protein
MVNEDGPGRDLMAFGCPSTTSERLRCRDHRLARRSPSASASSAWSMRRRHGEVLHMRLRKGSASTSRGMQRFCDELIARLQRAGAIGPKLLRADSGFWSNDTFKRP